MKRIPWNNDWYFTPHYEPALTALNAPQENLEAVRLPHTVAMLPFNEFSEQAYQMVSGYLRFFTPPESWRGKRVRVTFEGAAHFARVYLNGALLAQHGCGYTAFTVDLTDRLRWGETNNLTVELDSRETLDVPPFGNVIDYLTYGGLYREVFLEVGGPAFINDLCVRADMDGSVRCLPACENAAGLTLRLAVCSESGGELARWEGDAEAEEALLKVEQPALWDCEHPNLYHLKAALLQQGEPVDERTVRFGFRRVEFRADGFYLNGRRVQLRGLDRHQSWPYMGYAVPARAQRLDADILKYELGCNAVRTSHYPQSQHFIDRCDEIGLLVFTEIPGWQHIGGDAWKAQALVNTEEMVLQWRNHPSIFLWGCASTRARTTTSFIAAQTNSPTGWTPPAPPAECAISPTAICSRMFTPTTISPTTAPTKAARPAIPSPRQRTKAISSASTTATCSPPRPATGRASGWSTLCATPGW